MTQFFLFIPSELVVFPLQISRSISVGGPNRVWALDSVNRLYLRQEVTSVFPEGTSWLQVASSGQVRSISAHANELWAVLDSVSPGSAVVSGLVTVLAGGSSSGGGAIVGNARGVLVRRSGVTPNDAKGMGWDIAIGVRLIVSVNIYNDVFS